MRIVISEFMSLDGVVQGPGGPEEDTDGGFANGGWTHPFFDPEFVGGAFDKALRDADALLYGRRTWQNMAVLSEDLVDELRLMIMPVLVGGGKKIFPEDGGLKNLELESAVTSPVGVQVCTFRRTADK